MTEFEKMRSEQLYDFSDPEILESLRHAKEACVKLQTMTITTDGYREVIEDLIPGIPEDSTVCPPFHCDHGNGIRIGRNVFVNYNCTMLDGAMITLEDNVKIGPHCQLYTPQTAYPITIGEDTWLGGGVIVCPGVKIGKRCIIGAGSVVTKDIPDDCVAAGNPARVIRKLEIKG